MIHEVENDDFKNKVFVKCVYEDGTEKEIIVPNASLKEMIKRRISGEAINKFQIYNKKRMIIDDIELSVPFNVSPWIYFGKRISAYKYYQDKGLNYPIGEYDELLGRNMTANDLATRNYILLLNNEVVKNPEVGSVTVEEIRDMLVKNNNNDKPKSL